MKFVLLALSFLSLPAFAAEESITYTCAEYKVPANRAKLLTLVVPAKIKEGKSFYMTVSLGENNGRAFRQLFNKQAVGITEDVMLNFEVKRERISGIVFMDELDQTALSYNGKDYRFDCGSQE